MQRWVLYTVLVFCLSLSGRTQAQAQTELEGQLEQSGNFQSGDPTPKRREPEVKSDITTLGKLSPFQDVAVIQKRFLPKTHRFEAFPSVGAVINQAFFMSYIFSGRFTYHFTESMGLEANGAVMSTNERPVTSTLRGGPNQIRTSSIVNAYSYYGLDFRWSPIYGKMGWMNKKIIPFDMYFAGGPGVTQTNLGNSDVTAHLGTGQIFAISKSMAARWDMSWYLYNDNGSFTDMHFTLGLSFFFPGAKYR